MKKLTQIPLLVFSALVIVSPIASADDTRLRDLLGSERPIQPQHAQPPERRTIGVYAGERSFARSSTVQMTEPTERNTTLLHLGRGETIQVASTVR